MLTLLGVVVGASLTFLSQLVSSRRDDNAKRRTERLDACAQFVAAAENARGAQYARWWSKHDSRGVDERAAAKNESYSRRTEMHAGRSRLRLLGVGGQTGQAADCVVESLSTMHQANDSLHIEALGHDVLTKIEAFSDVAANLFSA
jgi:hypothetical protein